MRVVTPDVGGGFGTKLFPYREYALAAVAAQRLERPVKWVADRTEHFLGDAQGRDNITTARARARRRTVASSRSRSISSPTWARISRATRRSFPISAPACRPASTTFAACHVRVRGAYTNTVPVDAYRGAGRPEAAYVIERLVDVAARELGIAPDALRRQQLHQAEGDALHDADRQDLRLRRVRRPHGARAGARRLGRASSSAPRQSQEGAASCAASGSRPISRPAAATGRRPRPCGSSTDGGVTVLIGTQSTGQGHADRLCAARRRASRPAARPRPRRPGRHRPDRDRRRHRRLELDPLRRRLGRGRGATSSPTISRRSPPTRSKPRAGDLEIADGAVRVAGTDRADLVRRSRAARRRRAPTCSRRPTPSRRRAPTYPNGTHLAEVEIDPETGAIATRQLRRGRRFRRDAQSAAARRPGAWRRRAGHRPGADGEHGLRRAIPASS